MVLDMVKVAQQAFCLHLRCHQFPILNAGEIGVGQEVELIAVSDVFDKVLLLFVRLASDLFQFPIALFGERALLQYFYPHDALHQLKQGVLLCLQLNETIRQHLYEVSCRTV